MLEYKVKRSSDEPKETGVLFLPGKEFDVYKFTKNLLRESKDRKTGIENNRNVLLSMMINIWYDCRLMIWDASLFSRLSRQSFPPRMASLFMERNMREQSVRSGEYWQRYVDRALEKMTLDDRSILTTMYISQEPEKTAIAKVCKELYCSEATARRCARAALERFMDMLYEMPEPLCYAKKGM